MLKVVKTQLARKLWRIAKTLHLPVSEVANMPIEELDFYDFSLLADDPKRLEQYENSYADPEYEAFEKAFDAEMEQKAERQQAKREQEKAERELREAREKAEREEQLKQLAFEGYDVPVQAADDEEWERVDD